MSSAPTLDQLRKPDCAVCGRPYSAHNIGTISTCPIIATYRPATPPAEHLAVGDAEGCQRCFGHNPPWHAPSPLWNAVMRGGSINGEPLFSDMVCARCFMEIAEASGIARGWRLDAAEISVALETVTPSGRVWDNEQGLWTAPPPPLAESVGVEEIGALRKALDELLAACRHADDLCELHDSIDGSLLDAAQEALDMQYPIIWTQEQVDALNARQEKAGMHPYTCGGDRGDAVHKAQAAEDGTDAGQLIATRRGWVCPSCDHRQFWSHETGGPSAALTSHPKPAEGMVMVPREPTEAMLCWGVEAMWPGDEAVYPDEHEGVEAAIRATWTAMLSASNKEGG